MKTPSHDTQSAFQRWQRGLVQKLRPKAGAPAAMTLGQHHAVTERQIMLEAAVTGGPDSLAQYLRQQLGIEADERIDAPQLLRPVTSFEYRHPPLDLERELAQKWAGVIHPRDASRPLFWTLCHIDWLEQGYFASDISSVFLGTLNNGTPEEHPDDATRNLLRRMGGLHYARGKVSVRVDCPLSRAWWRARIAAKAANASHGDISEEQAHSVLHSSNGGWAALAEESVRRIPVINHPAALAALACYFYSTSNDSQVKIGKLFTGERVRRTIHLVGRQGRILSFQHVPWEQMKRLVEEAASSSEK